MIRRKMALFAVALTGLFILAACAEAAQPTATTVPANPTAAPSEATPTPGGGTPQPTATPVPGDPVAGEAVFTANGCSACHGTGVGPDLAGVGDRAGTRVSGLSADGYIRQSLMDPGAYVVDGFDPLMPAFTSLSSTEVNNLIAYLKTLQ